MSNSNTTAHEGVDNNGEAEEEVPLEDLIKDDRIGSHQILKAKRQIIEKMVEERVTNNGMSEDAARKEVEGLVSKVLNQKKEQETYRHGEFDHDFLKVYMHDSFLGSVSLEVTKVADASMPTAYVGVRPNGKSHEIIMGFNPKFFRSLNSKQRQGVIKHEMYHLIFQHIFDRAVGDKEYQVLWNWACFPPGTLLADGTPIEEAGKSTYGQSGEVDIVTPMSRHYSGDMYKIRAGGMTYTATDEHPFRVVRRKNSYRPIRLNQPEWIEAKNIQKGDYLIVPKLPGTFNEKLISLEEFLTEGADAKGRKTFSNRVPNLHFPLNEETAWLLGLYTAEGSGKDRISLALGSHETELINKAMEIARRLEYTPSTKLGSTHKTVTNVRFGGPVLAKAFKAWCGDGAKNKRVPEFILLNDNKNIVKAYLQGLVDGDGWEYKKNNSNITTIGHGTNSRLLASHVRLCLAKLDIGFSGSDKPQKDRYIRERFIPGGGEFYRTDWTWTPSLTKRILNGKEVASYSHSWKSLEEGIAIPVREVSAEKYEGPVYNIETSDHTYIVDGILVHNCDLAINSIIGKENLPDACLIPGHNPIDPKTGKPIEGPYAEFIKNAEPLKSSDYYFEELRKIQQEQDKDGQNSVQIAIDNGMGTLDDHGKWEDLPPEVQDAIRDKVNDMLDRAVKKAERNNDWGSVPFEIQQVIRKILSREVDWRSIVRNFMGRCRTMDRISTIRRINKKNPYMFPGVKRKYVATFACFIDQSGSMSDEDISMLFSELESFAQHTQLDVYHFDTEVDPKSHTVWKKGRPFPPAHRTRCGGTSFQCVADFCNQKENRSKWSGVVILTDGYAPGMGQIVGSKVLWVITEHGTKDSVGNNDLVVQMKKEKQFKRW